MEFFEKTINILIEPSLKTIPLCPFSLIQYHVTDGMLSDIGDLSALAISYIQSMK